MRASAHHMNARLRAFLDHFGFRYEFYCSTATYKSGRLRCSAAAHPGQLRQGDGGDAAHAWARSGSRPIRHSFPSARARGKVLLAKVVERDVAKGTITYVEEDGSDETVPVTGGHCKLQWKPDIGHALGGAGRGLRDVRQGPSRPGAALRRDLQDRRRRAARAVHVRTVPGRQGPEDFQVQGQRHHHRRMAGLWLAGKPGAVHVPEAAHRQAALFRRDPQGGGRIHRLPGSLSCATRPATRSGWKIRSGTSMAARCRRSAIRSASRCCSIWSAPRTRTIATCCGASSAPMRRTLRRRPIRAWTGWSAMRCAITRIS